MVLANCGIGLTTLGVVETMRVLWTLSFLGFHPFPIHVVNFYFDWLDFGIAVHVELSRADYDRIDKLFDLVYYVAALIYEKKNFYIDK